MSVSKLILFDCHTSPQKKNVSLNQSSLEIRELAETIINKPKNVVSNYENIVSCIAKFPGLRFYQLKKEISIANGTLQYF